MSRNVIRTMAVAGALGLSAIACARHPKPTSAASRPDAYSVSVVGKTFDDPTVPVTATWRTPAGADLTNDMIVLIQSNAPFDHRGGGPYQVHAEKRPIKGLASGSVTFRPLKYPAEYDVRYYKHGSWDKEVARSQKLRVGTQGAELAASVSRVTPGEPVTVSWKMPARLASDTSWIILARASSGNCVWCDQETPRYGIHWGGGTQGRASGTLTIPGDATARFPPDTYEFRYFLGGGIFQVAVSDKVTVDLPPPKEMLEKIDSPLSSLGSAALVAGHYHACVLLPNLEVRCWGQNGEPGHGPSSPQAGLQGTQLTASLHHTCVINVPGVRLHKQSDRVTCFGESRHLLAPATLELDPVQIAAGDGHTCALNKDGSVKCWGVEISQSTPPAGLKARFIASSGLMNCAIRTGDSGVTCWGRRVAEPPAGLKALRIAVADDPSYLSVFEYGTPGEVPGVPLYRHACAIKTDHRVVCWGDNQFGETNVPDGLRAKELALGTQFSCALPVEGPLQCWGHLDQTFYGKLQAKKLSGISAGGSNLCGLTEENTAICRSTCAREGNGWKCGAGTEVAAR